MRAERLRLRAQAGSLQYTPPVLRLRTCPECGLPAVLCPDIRMCAPCGLAAGTPTRTRFVQMRDEAS